MDTLTELADVRKRLRELHARETELLDLIANAVGPAHTSRFGRRVKSESLRQRAIAALRDADRPLTSGNVMSILGENGEYVAVLLSRLKRDGVVIHDGTGYRIAPPNPSDGGTA